MVNPLSIKSYQKKIWNVYQKIIFFPTKALCPEQEHNLDHANSGHNPGHSILWAQPRCMW